MYIYCIVWIIQVIVNGTANSRWTFTVKSLHYIRLYMLEVNKCYYYSITILLEKIVYLWSGKIVVTLTAGWCVLKFLFHTFIQNFGLEISPCTEEKKNYLSCRTCYSAKQWGNRYSQSLTGSIMTQQHKCHLLSWHFHQEKQDSTWSFCMSLFFLEITVERKRPHL